MEMRLVVLKEDRVIILKLTGQLTYENWLKSTEAVWHQPDYDQSFRAIIDYRDIELKMTVSEIKEIVKLFNQRDDEVLKGDAVLLIGEPLSAALASIYADATKAVANTNVTTTEEGAANRLGLSVSVFQTLDGSDVVKLFFEE